MGKASKKKEQRPKSPVKEAEREKPAKPWWREVLELILLAAVLAFAFKMLLFDTRSIPSSSMVPTIDPGDRVIMSRLSYRGDNSPERGDIVVFRAPEELNEKDDLIKRVVALPGEEVQVSGGAVYINGQALNEPYLAETPAYEFGPYTVPEGCYFVLGDNRNWSNDAHLWPEHHITEDSIKGKAIWRYWPLSRFGAIYE
ncbi:MAG: signal peptidase I [Firmicutes bacterium]|nr:signal peptidase I [Bacillota bacterium]